MNDSFVMRQAQKLSARSLRETGNDTTKAIDRMYRLTLGRPPSGTEATRAEALAHSHSLDDVAWTLLNATEFVYVD